MPMLRLGEVGIVGSGSSTSLAPVLGILLITPGCLCLFCTLRLLIRTTSYNATHFLLAAAFTAALLALSPYLALCLGARSAWLLVLGAHQPASCRLTAA